uniref:Peptidase C1A papain C-terminal domain-containing protein n=1 Tax=Brassica oleracea var. oleracea TaxID=109376 RepID=A0A0D3B4T1_BRAOL
MTSIMVMFMVLTILFTSFRISQATSRTIPPTSCRWLINMSNRCLAFLAFTDVAGSFSAVAGVERVTKIASGRIVSFSEQQLLDCDREYTTKAVTASPQRSPTLTKDQMGHAGPVQYQLHGSEVFSTSLATTSGYCWRLYRGTCFCLDGRECCNNCEKKQMRKQMNKSDIQGISTNIHLDLNPPNNRCTRCTFKCQMYQMRFSAADVPDAPSAPDVQDALSSARCTINAKCTRCVLQRQICSTRARRSSSAGYPNGLDVPKDRMSQRIRRPNRLDVPMDQMSQRTRRPNGPDVLTDQTSQRTRRPNGPDILADPMSLQTRCPNGPDVLADQIPRRARCPCGPDAPTGMMTQRANTYTW